MVILAVAGIISLYAAFSILVTILTALWIPLIIAGGIWFLIAILKEDRKDDDRRP
jgi:hypothetical protein